jgi:hypothetical protein
MKKRSFTLSLALILYFLPGHAVNFKEYVSGRYKIRFVQHLPSSSENITLIISNRYFLSNENFTLKRGVQPHYGMFYFLAAFVGDSAFIMPISNMNEASGYLPENRDFLVYVDGHGKNFNQIVERGFDLSVRFDINLVVFDWPTDYMALRKTLRNADDVSGNFVQAMVEFAHLHDQYYKSSSVSAFFHSMGNHILKNVTDKHLLKYMPSNLFSNLILNAASVSQQGHARWIEKLNLQKRIYITINSNDRTLQGARILRGSKQLGLGYKGRIAQNAQYVNFSNLATTDHNLFLGKSMIEKNNKYIYSLYDQILHGREVNFKNDMAYQILSPSEICFRLTVQ